MRRYAARLTAALAAFAAGVALAALPALLPGVRLNLHYGWGEDFVTIVLSFLGGLACYVLVAAGWHGLRRDLLFNALFFLVGSALLLLCMMTLTTMFTFGDTELMY